MIELARKDSDEIVAIEREDKENKYEYKTNVNILIGSLKDKLIMMYLEGSTSLTKNEVYRSENNTISKITLF